MKKNINDLVDSWLQKADLDLQAAQKLEEFHSLSTIVCFHAQQACEKYFKAYLTFLLIDFPKIHNLERLIDLLSNSDNDVMKFKKSCGELSPFAVEARYPEFNKIESDFSSEAIKTAKEIKKYILSQIAKDIK